uniref:Sialin n=1 Tax=Aceria tosichella TaxID=561515 RepID=A0A6G1SLM3_9ACAR
MDFHYVERDRPKKASFIKVRLMIAVLATLCPVVCYISRQNLPFAIVSMVDEPITGSTTTNEHLKQHQDAGRQDGPVITNKSPIVPDSIMGDDLGLLADQDNNNNRNHNKEPATFDLRNSRRLNGTYGLNIKTTSTTTSPTTTSSALKPPFNSNNNEAGQSSSVVDLKDTCPEPVITDESGKTVTLAKTKTYGPKYSWTQDDKGYLLGAFFYTYVIFQIPGARLAERVGAKWILATASLGSAVLSFVAPWAAGIHVHLFSLVRLLMGMFQAALYPACFTLYSKWLPPNERSQGLPLLCVGAYVGSIIASGLTGYFSEQERFGWEYSFYVPGVLCLLWSVAWIWYGSNEPRDHKYISIEELQSIEMRMEISSLQLDRANQRGHNNQRSSSIEGLERGAVDMDTRASATSLSNGAAKKDISWMKLVKSQSIWAMMAAFFASNWSFTIVLLLMPTYLNNILRVSPMQNGIINSIIYVIYCICSPLVGAGSTMMVETRACGFTRLGIRKLFQGTALLGQAVCFVAIAWIGCDGAFVFAILYIQIVFFSLVNGGEVQLPSEISVDFSGTIYAIGNCVGSSTGFIVPFVFSQIVTDPYSRSHWDTYFYTAAVITALGATIFLIFGQNKMQDFSLDVDDPQLDFSKFGGLVGAKGSSFNLDSCKRRGQRQQQQPPQPAPIIRSLPPFETSAER